MQAGNFTKSFIEGLPIPLQGYSYYRDTKLRGLFLYVTPNDIRTFYVRKKINGKDQKLIVGQFPGVSVENARKQALNFMGQVAFGKNPLEEKKQQQKDRLTLGEQFHEYMERHSKVNKKSWHYDEREIKKFYGDWFNKRLSDIKKEDVQLRHEKIRKENGIYQANRSLERIRSMYNRAIEWGWKGENPAKGIKKYREKSRDRFILPNELPCFYRALNEEENITARDFLTMLLLTGARKTNTLMMRFDEIIWELRNWRIPDTKNGDPHIVVLVERAMEILERRRKLTNSSWVFPNETDGEKHFVNPKRAWKRILQKATIYFWESDEKFASLVKEVMNEFPTPEETGLLFNTIKKEAKRQKIELPVGLMDIRIHDIRRTVGSYQAITGASLQIIGKSLGHKSSAATSIYARMNLDPVKESLEKAIAAMLIT